jgi:general secretion pathway protein H
MPTSKISPERQRSHAYGFPAGALQQGFTLIELMVVLAIGAMLVGLVPVAFSKMQEGSQYRDTVRGVVTGLRQAREQAKAKGHDVVFQVDLVKRQFGIQGETPIAFPASLEVKTTTAEFSALPISGLSLIAFMPEGGSTGGTIELVRASGAGVRIRVDWLLGQVTQEPRVL